MKAIIPLAILSVAPVLGSGCATAQFHATTNEQGWLDEDRVELAMKKQGQIRSKSTQAALDHDHQLMALQQQADILLELCNSDQMQMLNSKSMNSFPKGKFPISDLQKYLPPKKRHQSIAFVVVIVPGIWGGEPTELDLMRRIDMVMVKGGVQRRMFQTFYHSWSELHSGPN